MIWQNFFSKISCGLTTCIEVQNVHLVVVIIDAWIFYTLKQKDNKYLTWETNQGEISAYFKIVWNSYGSSINTNMLLHNLLHSICYYNDSLLWVSGVTVIPSFSRFSASSFFKTATSAFVFSICRKKLSILWQKQISKNDFAQFGKLFYLCHLLSHKMWPYWCMDVIESEKNKNVQMN